MVALHPYAIPGALPGGQLYNYQLEALERTDAFGGRALIAGCSATLS